MKVSELGEFGLIDLLAVMISGSKSDQPGPGQLVIGLGDDAAAWRSDDSIELATVDAMVQGIHFTLDTISWRELGWKSLAINLSDIAAMGGVPRYALVALGLPEDTRVEDVSLLYEGMIELAQQTGTGIVGGNISRSPVVAVTITVIGGSPDGRVLRRSTARPGDTIAITGHPGCAAAGLEMLKKKMKLPAPAGDHLRAAFLSPTPRLDEGRTLIKCGVETAIDTSDGLLADLRHICEASRVSARINVDNLPIHPAVSENFGERARTLALSGGEDYELLFTAAAPVIKRVKTDLAGPVTAIGRITAGEPGKISLFDAAGKTVEIKEYGWSHF
jgi:thiamine-monophosphate kinase